MNLPLRQRQSQNATVIYGIMSIVLILVILQLWLLTATMHAWLGGDEDVVLPAAIASLICLGFNLGLLRFLNGLNR